MRGWLNGEPVVVLSRRRSKCPGCGEWIEEGDEITLAKADDYAEWVCESCGEDES